uniref:Uncharacterized protein n=1 Tax=Octopus bimaculoides TaxID=37653 RepID=A0A0L8II49_OCTBM
MKQGNILLSPSVTVSNNKRCSAASRILNFLHPMLAISRGRKGEGNF